MNALEKLKYALDDANYRVCDIDAIVVHRFDNERWQWVPNYLQKKSPDENDLLCLNFEEDGCRPNDQETCGTVWMKDGSWFTMDEWCANAWWEHHKRPAIEF